MPRRFFPSLGLFALLFVACADPPTPSESLPSEVTISSERRPEDGSPSEETTAEPRPESLPEPPPDACQAACPRITRLEGEGTVAAPVYPNGVTAPSGAVEAKARFRETWVVEGEHLDRLTRLTLVSTEDKTKIFELLWEGQASMTKRTVRVPKTLVAGMFLLVGFVATTPVALGQTFVLQGEKGDQGEAGQGFDSPTLAFVNLLKGFFGKSTSAKLAAEAPALELKAGAASVSLDATSRTLLCQGANVQITNGSGKTDQLNGVGNLLLGYNEPNTNPPVPAADKLKYRQGSHNLVVGIKHTYFSYGALLVGEEHASLAKFASISGGQGNAASGNYASVSGGQDNTASGNYASVSGGQGNNAGQALGMPTPPATHTYVCGGNKNYATSVNGVACSLSP